MSKVQSTTNAARLRRERLLALATGHIVAKAIYCAAELGVADHLREGPKSAQELADRTACSASHLHRLLMALASVGVFRYRCGKFEHSELSRYLSREDEESIRPAIRFLGDEMYRAIDGLLGTIRTGRGCWSEQLHRPIWEYLSERGDRGGVFDSVMSATSYDDLPEILHAYDFSEAKVIVDVGGGDGYVLSGILERHAKLRGVLFDLEPVVARAKVLRRQSAAYSRCEFVAGSFFDRVPHGDLHILRRVIHDWSDDDAVRILRICHTALHGGGKVLLVERAVSETHPDRATLWNDISMMAFGGKERTVPEYRCLLANAGLALDRVIDLPSGSRILEAHAAGPTPNRAQ